MTRPTQRIAVFAIGAVLIVSDLILVPRTSGAQGLLLALAVWSGFPLGALILRMIHGLTHGAWGHALAMPLRIGTHLTFMAVAAFALLALFQTNIYPWMAQPPDGPRHLYLSAFGLNLRGALILIAWSTLAVLLTRRNSRMIYPGPGLAVYALTMSFAAADWFMSVDPDRVNTAFGIMLGVQQLLTALCVGALLLPPEVKQRTVADIAGLMIACLLGLVYLEFMTYVVDWYGNLPSKVEWYLQRSNDGAIAALLLTLVCALTALRLLIACRHHRRHVQGAAIVALFAITTHWVWLLVPSFVETSLTLGAALAGFAALILMSIALEPGLLSMDWTIQHEPSQPASARAPTPLRPLRASTYPQNRERISSEAPDVAIGPILTIVSGFGAFVAIVLGALRFYVGIAAPGSVTGLKPAAAESELTIPAAQADTLKADQLSHIQAVEADSENRMTLDRALRIIVARGSHAYDPVSTRDLREPPP